MPIYIYQNPKTKKTKEIIQTMNEPHEYSENGVKWQRVFTVPQASFVTKIDPFSSKQYVDKTGNMKGTYGDLLDLSAELSEKRAEKFGEDPIKRQHFNEYEKKTGKKHLADRPTKYEDSMVSIDYSAPDPVSED